MFPLAFVSKANAAEEETRWAV